MSSPEIKVELATPTEAARDPLHPDHAQWVKDQMIQRDASWLRSLGVEVSRRKIDIDVDRGLMRLAARKREKRQQPARQRRTQRDRTPMRTGERLAMQAGARLIRRPIRDKPKAPPYLCNKCGICIRCRREYRAKQILRLGRIGDTKIRPLALELVRVALRAQAKVGEFELLGPHDADRAITRAYEDVCDRSVPMMGEWRP